MLASILVVTSSVAPLVIEAEPNQQCWTNSYYDTKLEKTMSETYCGFRKPQTEDDELLKMFPVKIEVKN